MTDQRATVVIVVDPAFGERIRALAPEIPVWVVDTPVNRAAAQRFWPNGPEHGTRVDITTFIARAGESPERVCMGVLPTVDLHHNELSQSPPYSAVEVHGASPTPELQAALEELGLVVVEKCGAHFVARRRESGGLR